MLDSTLPGELDFISPGALDYRKPLSWPGIRLESPTLFLDFLSQNCLFSQISFGTVEGVAKVVDGGLLACQRYHFTTNRAQGQILFRKAEY